MTSTNPDSGQNPTEEPDTETVATQGEGPDAADPSDEPAPDDH